MTNGRHIQNIPLSDVTTVAKEAVVKYRDEELIIIDGLRNLDNNDCLKIDYNMLLFCLEGEFSMEVGGRSVTVSAGQLFICHSRTLLAGNPRNADFNCNVVCMSDLLLHQTLGPHALLWSRMLYNSNCLTIHTDIAYTNIYHEMRKQWLSADNMFRHDIIMSLLRVGLLKIMNEIMFRQNANGPVMPPSTDPQVRMELIFHRFMENISRRKVKYQDVAIYAGELCVTPKYLSTVCHRVSGKSPREWIADYVVSDIVYYLKNTSLTVQEIASELGFLTSTAFCKYVRQHLGVSPVEYRKGLQ